AGDADPGSVITTLTATAAASAAAVGNPVAITPVVRSAVVVATGAPIRAARRVPRLATIRPLASRGAPRALLAGGTAAARLTVRPPLVDHRVIVVTSAALPCTCWHVVLPAAFVPRLRS